MHVGPYSTADALLAAVIASPDDDLPRLVFADWLDENGQPERAEFIRLQIGRENGTLPAEGVIREKALHQTHAERWLAPMRQSGEPLFTQRSHAEFRRGFIETVWLPATWFVRTADRLFTLAPVAELRVMFDKLPDVPLLVECEHFLRLRSLDVCDKRYSWSVTVCLYKAGDRCRGLKTLRLPSCNINLRAVPFLCDSQLSLDHLDLRYNPLSEDDRQRLRDRFGNAVVFE